MNRFSFFLGYFFHLVTDNLWMESIARPTLSRFAAEFEADPAFIWEVKRDWYGLDFVYLDEHPGSLFWRVLGDCAYSQDYLDFMPPQAVQQRIAVSVHREIEKPGFSAKEPLYASKSTCGEAYFAQ